MSQNNKGTDCSIIKAILEHGGTLGLPHKRNLSSWFDCEGVKLGEDDGKYVIFGAGLYINRKEFDNLEEALEEFLAVHANNTGAIQEYVRKKNPHIMSPYGDMDEDELKRLVRNEKARRKRANKC